MGASPTKDNQLEGRGAEIHACNIRRSKVRVRCGIEKQESQEGTKRCLAPMNKGNPKTKAERYICFVKPKHGLGL